MDTDKFRKLTLAVYAASRRAAKGTPRISIPAELTDDDQMLWQVSEVLGDAANELDTLRELMKAIKQRAALFTNTDASKWGTVAALQWIELAASCALGDFDEEGDGKGEG